MNLLDKHVDTLRDSPDYLSRKGWDGIGRAWQVAQFYQHQMARTPQDVADECMSRAPLAFDSAHGQGLRAHVCRSGGIQIQRNVWGTYTIAEMQMVLADMIVARDHMERCGFNVRGSLDEQSNNGELSG